MSLKTIGSRDNADKCYYIFYSLLLTANITSFVLFFTQKSNRFLILMCNFISLFIIAMTFIALIFREKPKGTGEALLTKLKNFFIEIGGKFQKDCAGTKFSENSNLIFLITQFSFALLDLKGTLLIVLAAISLTLYIASATFLAIDLVSRSESNDSKCKYVKTYKIFVASGILFCVIIAGKMICEMYNSENPRPLIYISISFSAFFILVELIFAVLLLQKKVELKTELVLRFTPVLLYIVGPFLQNDFFFSVIVIHAIKTFTLIGVQLKEYVEILDTYLAGPKHQQYVINSSSKNPTIY